VSRKKECTPLRRGKFHFCNCTLKWNFLDLRQHYVAAGEDALFKSLLVQSDAIRLEFLRLLTEFNATVLIAAIQGHSLNDLKTRREYLCLAKIQIVTETGDTESESHLYELPSDNSRWAERQEGCSRTLAIERRANWFDLPVLPPDVLRPLGRSDGATRRVAAKR
jgi:hypothetical protein